MLIQKYVYEILIYIYMLVLINWINFIASFKRKLFQKVFSRYLYMVILFTINSYSIPPSPSRYIFLHLTD